MTDTLEQVYEHIKAHPFVTIDATQKVIRAPVQEVEACFDSLRRAGRIAQAMPGLWTVCGYPVDEYKPLKVEPPPPPKPVRPPKGKRNLLENRGLIPLGFKRCACCRKVKRHADFGRDYCYVCHRLKRRRNWAKHNPIPAVDLYGESAPGRRRVSA